MDGNRIIMNDLISIIMPTFNRAHMIERALKSIFQQTHQKIEIIIVDDVSEDNTEEVIQELNDNRITYIRHTENKGPGAARNTGLKHAKSNYIAFLDSDDEYTSNALIKKLTLLQTLDRKPGLVFSNYLEIGTHEHLHISHKTASHYVTTHQFPASVFTPPSCWMIDRNIIGNESFDEEIRTSEDMDLFARIVRKSPAYFLNEPLTTKHVHTCKKGSVPISYAEHTRERLLEKWLPEMKKDKKFLTNFYLTMGKDLVSANNTQKAQKAFWQAFCLSPLNLKIARRLLKTYFQH